MQGGGLGPAPRLENEGAQICRGPLLPGVPTPSLETVRRRFLDWLARRLCLAFVGYRPEGSGLPEWFSPLARGLAINAAPRLLLARAYE